MLGWKLGLKVSGKGRPLICPKLGPSFHTQVWWQLGPWPRNPYSCLVWISCYFFPPKAINITRSKCICFLYFFWNDSDLFVCLFVYIALKRSSSVWTSKKPPHLTVPLENFHFLRVHGDGAFTGGVWVSLFSLFISLFIFLCVWKLMTWQAAQYL